MHGLPGRLHGAGHGLARSSTRILIAKRFKNNIFYFFKFVIFYFSLHFPAVRKCSKTRDTFKCALAYISRFDADWHQTSCYKAVKSLPGTSLLLKLVRPTPACYGTIMLNTCMYMPGKISLAIIIVTHWAGTSRSKRTTMVATNTSRSTHWRLQGANIVTPLELICCTKQRTGWICVFIHILTGS